MFINVINNKTTRTKLQLKLVNFISKDAAIATTIRRKIKKNSRYITITHTTDYFR